MALGVEKLIQRNRTAKKELEEKYFQAVRNSPEFHRMKEWVAYLLESPSAAFTSA